MTESRTAKKITGGIIAIIILSVCLIVTTAALVYSSVAVENNYFRTGEVKLNLNDGEPIISEHEFLFEPGMMVKKDFFIRNESTWDVYYRIYFDNISGGLADVLDVTIKNGETVLYSGKPSELVRSSVPAAEDKLAVGERRELTVYFYFPKEAGNEAQISDFEFTVCAEATQTKNNPDKKFD